MSARSEALDATLAALVVAVNTALPILSASGDAVDDAAAIDRTVEAMSGMQRAIVAALPPGTPPVVGG